MKSLFKAFIPCAVLGSTKSHLSGCNIKNINQTHAKCRTRTPKTRLLSLDFLYFAMKYLSKYLSLKNALRKKAQLIIKKRI